MTEEPQEVYSIRKDMSQRLTEKEKRIMNRFALRIYEERLFFPHPTTIRGFRDDTQARIPKLFVLPPEEFEFPYPEVDMADDQETASSMRKTSQELLVQFLGGQCKVCGSTNNLQKHHIIPLEKGGPDTVQNLMVLCRECHEKTF